MKISLAHMWILKSKSVLRLVYAIVISFLFVSNSDTTVPTTYSGPLVVVVPVEASNYDTLGNAQVVTDVDRIFFGPPLVSNSDTTVPTTYSGPLVVVVPVEAPNYDTYLGNAQVVTDVGRIDFGPPPKSMMAKKTTAKVIMLEQQISTSEVQSHLDKRPGTGTKIVFLLAVLVLLMLAYQYSNMNQGGGCLAMVLIFIASLILCIKIMNAEYDELCFDNANTFVAEIHIDSSRVVVVPPLSWISIPKIGNGRHEIETFRLPERSCLEKGILEVKNLGEVGYLWNIGRANEYWTKTYYYSK